jgi:lysophospholipase L1-like esterase
MTRRAVGAATRRWAGGLLPGAAARRRQVEAHRVAWDEDRALAVAAEGPLWVVLGDSTAQAIGASSIRTGYVGQVAAALSARDAVRWRVVNLSRSGAVAADVLADQLPRLADLPAAALVSCAVGGNDLLRRRTTLLDDLRSIAAGLPPGALLANLPRGLRERHAAAVNRVVEAAVAAHDLRLVDLWATTGPPWRGRFSADRFHPNDLGYAAWAAAFLAALGDGPG